MPAFFRTVLSTTQATIIIPKNGQKGEGNGTFLADLTTYELMSVGVG
jgi:hypothetical protein